MGGLLLGHGAHGGRAATLGLDFLERRVHPTREGIEGLPMQRGKSRSRRCGVWLGAQAEPWEGARPAGVGAGLLRWLRSMDAGLKAEGEC